jgi:putative membrane protein
MRRTLWTAAPAVALLPLLCGAAPALAAASGSDVTVTNTETVQAHLDASGSLKDARVYDQLALHGDGTTTVRNPVSTNGLRNLDGFKGFSVKDGVQVTTLDVHGERRLRSVSNYDKDLPLEVKVTYTLDGKSVQPGDVVGRSGDLAVHFVVTNRTTKTESVSYDDGKGGTAAAKATTVVPMIGELITTLPASFTAVHSAEAAVGGDGHGGTRLQYQMTLFPPIGSATAEFGYTAHVSKGVVPSATLTALPVSPLDFPSYKDGSASIEAGAQQGVDLTSGAVQLDAGVLQLHDGAAQLLAGLLQLKDGADQLHAGLADSAVPGANQLADGLTKDAAPGADKLADGLNKQALPGASQVAAGAVQLDAGLGQAATQAPALVGGLGQISAGLSSVDAGLASLSTTLGGSRAAATAQLHTGLAQVFASIGSSTQLTIPGTTPAKPTLYGGLVALGEGASNGFTQINASLDQLHQGLLGVQGLLSAVVPADPANPDPNLLKAQATLAYLDGKVQDRSSLDAQATALSQGVLALECGIDRATSPACTSAGLSGAATATEALHAIDAGIDTMVDTIIANVQAAIGSPTTDPRLTLRGGVGALSAGMGQIGAQAGPLVGGLQQLSSGAAALKQGTAQLASGINDAAKGSKDLASGLKDAASGSRTLAGGLNDAASGSQQLADGLAQTTDPTTGAPALVDGAQQLSGDGTSQLVGSGEDTAKSFGTQYAVLQVEAKRASTEGMAYGAPEGASGATAYSIEIAGVDGSGSRALLLGLVGVVLFGVGAGAASIVRRRLA